MPAGRTDSISVSWVELCLLSVVTGNAFERQCIQLWVSAGARRWLYWRFCRAKGVACLGQQLFDLRLGWGRFCTEATAQLLLSRGTIPALLSHCLDLGLCWEAMLAVSCHTLLPERLSSQVDGSQLSQVLPADRW